jgi:O-antigen ligase
VPQSYQCISTNPAPRAARPTESLVVFARALAVLVLLLLFLFLLLLLFLLLFLFVFLLLVLPLVVEMKSSSYYLRVRLTLRLLLGRPRSDGLRLWPVTAATANPAAAVAAPQLLSDPPP